MKNQSLHRHCKLHASTAHAHHVERFWPSDDMIKCCDFSDVDAIYMIYIKLALEFNRKTVTFSPMGGLPPKQVKSHPISKRDS